MSRKEPFQAEDFLEDVKHGIKKRYGNQAKFAKTIPISRNVISRILNNPQNLGLGWINLLAKTLGLDLRNYIS